MTLISYRPGRRTVAVTVLGAMLVAVAAWHYASLYRDATGARAAVLELEDTMSVMADLGLDATTEDLDAIDRQLGDARAKVDRAQTRMHWDPLLQGARWLPIAGDQVVAADAFLRMADDLLAVGDETVLLAREAFEARDAREALADDAKEPLTTTALDLLDRAGPRLDRIDTLLDDAVAARLEIGDRRLLGPLDEARTKIDEQLPGILELVDQARVARGVVPELLGFEGERRYLLLSLNNAELLPGGGLVTAAGILTVRDGDIVDTTFHDSRSWLPAYQATGGEFIPAPDPLQRHLLKDYSWSIGVSNWDPDFTVWAYQALEFFELAWGPQDVDGVVAVDLNVLQALLGLTGEQTVEAPGFGQISLTSENAIMELERVTRAPEDTWRRSKAAVGALQEALLRDVLELPTSKWSDLADTVQQLGDGRHMQALFFDEGAQRLVRDLGWDGHLVIPAEGDYLHLNEASVNSTKLNLVFAPEATYDIEVTALGTARHELTLRYENTVREWAEGLDPDFVTDLMYDGHYGGFLRAFVPADATSLRASLDGQPAPIEDTGSTGSHQWFGVYVPVPPDAAREATLAWSVPLATVDADTYTLTLQKQPGTDGLCIDLRIHRDGAPATVAVTGGTRDGDRVCLTTDVTVRATFPPATPPATP